MPPFPSQSAPRSSMMAPTWVCLNRGWSHLICQARADRLRGDCPGCTAKWQWLFYELEPDALWNEPYVVNSSGFIAHSINHHRHFPFLLFVIPIFLVEYAAFFFSRKNSTLCELIFKTVLKTTYWPEDGDGWEGVMTSSVQITRNHCWESHRESPARKTHRRAWQGFHHCMASPEFTHWLHPVYH